MKQARERGPESLRERSQRDSVDSDLGGFAYRR
jgi:hypothetical protein